MVEPPGSSPPPGCLAPHQGRSPAAGEFVFFGGGGGVESALQGHRVGVRALAVVLYVWRREWWGEGALLFIYLFFFWGGGTLSLSI